MLVNFAPTGPTTEVKSVEMHHEALTEANIVAGGGLSERFVVHLYRLDLSGGSGGGEVDEHARLDLASLDTTHGNRSNATNLVNVLQRKTQGLVDWPLWGIDVIETI